MQIRPERQVQASAVAAALAGDCGSVGAVEAAGACEPVHVRFELLTEPSLQTKRDPAQ